MKRISFFILLVGTFLLALPSCLTVEKKEYHFEFTGKETGILTIKYINIMSVIENEGDIKKDFDALITDYLEGDMIEHEYRFTKLISKRLFEEKGVLCGEVKLAFSEIMAAHLFQYEEGSPLMMSLKGDLNTEKYLSSNGNHGGEIMPVVFWSDEARNLRVVTNVTKPDQSSISLLQKFREWENSRPR